MAKPPTGPTALYRPEPGQNGGLYFYPCFFGYLSCHLFPFRSCSKIISSHSCVARALCWWQLLGKQYSRSPAPVPSAVPAREPAPLLFRSMAAYYYYRLAGLPAASGTCATAAGKLKTYSFQKEKYRLFRRGKAVVFAASQLSLSLSPYGATASPFRRCRWQPAAISLSVGSRPHVSGVVFWL